MRQRKWLELIKDDACTIDYHPGKANVVAYALSRKSRGGAGTVNLVRVTLFKNSEIVWLE